MANSTVGETSPISSVPPSSSPAKAIQATLVPEAQRMRFLPRVFGARFMRGEAMVYHWMSRLCADYRGGFWEFVDLSNGGFYLRLHTDKTVTLHVEGNDFSDALSADAAGIVVSLFALNTLVWEGAEELEDAYYALREYAIQHDEATSILRAVD